MAGSNFGFGLVALCILAGLSSGFADDPVFISVEMFERYTDNGDHTNVLEKAWDKACSTKNAVLVVPRGRTYSAKKLEFKGPCVSDIAMEMRGKIRPLGKGSDVPHWILFEKVDGLTITGNGTIDGNGQVWWKDSCKINKHKPCTRAPSALAFRHVKNLTVDEITVRHAQNMHLVVEESDNVTLSRVTISSPGDSPNTDGIHITHSTNVYILNSHIGAGDDCISIVSGSSDVHILDVHCGPGHGISIGSLGKDGDEAEVSNIHVNGATLTDTTNGVRIKTWQGGSGYAKNITFENLVMNNVANPIIIDQDYCNQNKPCSKSDSAVQVSKVTYRNIHGTSHSKEAIKLVCSDSHPCKGITFDNVTLVWEGRQSRHHHRHHHDHSEQKAKASCKNIDHVKKYGHVEPAC